MLIQHCEMSPIIQDHGISAGSDWVASGLWIVLKEKSMEIIKIASTSGYLASFSR